MAKKTAEDEWWEAFGYLSPQDQEATMAEMGYAPQSTMDFGYYGEEGLEDYPLMGVAATPEYTAKGALDPRDLTQVAKGINVAQDYGSLLVDNALTGLAGPGSYDVGAFTPTMEYGKEVTRPGEARLQSYASRGGWEGFLANEILNGGTPSSAMSSLQQFLENTDPEDPDLDENERAAYQSLTNSLPRSRDTELRTPDQEKNLGFWGDYDYDTLYKTAADYSDAIFKDPGFGYSEQGPDGTTRYYDTAPEEIKTPQMEFFDKYGLPYPTASYEDPKYLQAMLDAEEGSTPEQRDFETQDYTDRYRGVVDQTRAAEQAQRTRGTQEDDLLKAWESYQTQQAGLPAATAKPTRDTYLDQALRRADLAPTANRLQTSASARDRGASLEAANTAADIDFERAMETWQDEQAKRQMQPGAPWLRTTDTGEVGVLGGRRQARQGDPGFGSVLAQGATVADPSFALGSWFTGQGSQQRLKASDVTPEARKKRSDQSYDRMEKARVRQREVEAKDPRLNDIAAQAKLYWLARAGRTPLQDAIGQRRLGASRLGL